MKHFSTPLRICLTFFVTAMTLYNCNPRNQEGGYTQGDVEHAALQDRPFRIKQADFERAANELGEQLADSAARLIQSAMPVSSPNDSSLTSADYYKRIADTLNLSPDFDLRFLGLHDQQGSKVETELLEALQYTFDSGNAADAGNNIQKLNSKFWLFSKPVTENDQLIGMWSVTMPSEALGQFIIANYELLGSKGN